MIRQDREALSAHVARRRIMEFPWGRFLKPSPCSPLLSHARHRIFKIRGPLIREGARHDRSASCVEGRQRGTIPHRIRAGELRGRCPGTNGPLAAGESSTAASFGVVDTARRDWCYRKRWPRNSDCAMPDLLPCTMPMDAASTGLWWWTPRWKSKTARVSSPPFWSPVAPMPSSEPSCWRNSTCSSIAPARSWWPATPKVLWRRSNSRSPVTSLCTSGTADEVAVPHRARPRPLTLAAGAFFLAGKGECLCPSSVDLEPIVRWDTILRLRSIKRGETPPCR